MSESKFALITGCGEGGIGHALASSLKAKGYTVISTLLPSESTKHLESQGIKIAKTDVTSEESVESLKGYIETITGGELDMLINNAGIAYTMPAADSDLKAVEKMYAVNVLGPMRMVHHFHRMIIAKKGKIVNIGSIGGITPYVYGSAYNGTKAALVHWGATLRIEMLPFGVQVINVVSGEVGTNILKNDNFRTLPAGSVYSPMTNAFEAHVKRTPDTITPDEYAKGVVAEITKSKPKSWFWFGKQTTMIWSMVTFLPHTFWDWLFYRIFKLHELEDSVRFKGVTPEGAANGDGTVMNA